MTYEELADFVENKMRMSHIYQPVMLIELLKSGGRLRDDTLARCLLAYDQSQIEYYRQITNNMVGRVLRKHGIVERDRATKEYTIEGFENLTPAEIQSLVNKCQERLNSYIESRGDRIFQHRRKSAGYISGTLRYEVLKRAKFRCELCGISADEKALEVDHIIPRNHGGSDDISNLQALCYSCNAMKRDRDSTDFRAVRSAYKERLEGCIFCQPNNKSVLAENELAIVLLDGFPVTEGHRLIVPKRHTEDFFDLGQPEINACYQLMNNQKQLIQEEDKRVSGFNVGVNIGRDSGQTIPHCHIHLIPRRNGDADNPTGGVRNVIKGAGDYMRR